MFFAYSASRSDSITAFQTISDKDQVRWTHFRNRYRVIFGPHVIKAIEPKIRQALGKRIANNHIQFNYQCMAHEIILELR